MAKVAHLKGPEKEGKREPVYFATHADYVEGLNDKLDTKLDLKLEAQEDATTTSSGLMSAADKIKLNGIAAGAQVNNIETIKVNNTVLSITNKTVNIDISGKVDKVNGKDLSTNDYTTAEKNKLAGIAAGANNYSLPTASSSTLGGVKIGSGITISNGSISVANATTTVNGLMSAADKIKLNGIENTYVPRPTPTAFTIATGAWTKNNSETSEYVYYADITVSGLTTNDYAEINFNRASQSIIIDANLCPSGDTLSGKIRLYAENIPTANISGEYIITKGVV